jgi:hypothetical protein
VYSSENRGWHFFQTMVVKNVEKQKKSFGISDLV